MKKILYYFGILILQIIYLIHQQYIIVHFVNGRMNKEIKEIYFVLGLIR